MTEEAESVGTDHVWAIHALDSGADLHRRLAAYAHACTTTAGPVLDAARDGLPLRLSQGVAVIPLMGPMIRRGGALARMFGMSGTDDVRRAVESALADADVREIVMRVDSPGGSVSGLDQLGDVMNAADKPITAIVEGMAASAAYYVASQADSIFVGRNDLVGSIGTRMLLYDFSAAFEEMGVKPVVIDTGPYKSAGALGTEITDAQQAEFQRIVDFYFNDFVSVVARGRQMTENAVREAADGRMFTPTQAIEIGLIDGVSTYEAVLNQARRRHQTDRSADTARARLRV